MRRILLLVTALLIFFESSAQMRYVFQKYDGDENKYMGKWGIARYPKGETKGVWMIFPKYDDFTRYSTGLGFDYDISCSAKVTIAGKHGVVSQYGEELVPCKYDEIEFLWQTNDFVAKLNGKILFFNAKGQEFLQSNNYTAYTILPSSELVIINKGNGKNVVDFTNQKLLFEGDYKEVHFFNDVIRLTNAEDKYCFYNTISGSYSKWYDSVDKYAAYDYSAVKFNNKWGLIEVQSDKVVLPFDYQWVRTPRKYDALIYVMRDSLMGAIDWAQRQVIPHQYVSLSKAGYDAHYFQLKRGGKWGLINAQNQEIVPAQYDNISYWGDLNGFQRDSRWGYFTDGGVEMIPAKYKKVEQFKQLIIPLDNDQKFTGWAAVVDRGDSVLIINRMGEAVISLPQGSYSIDQGMGTVSSKYSEYYDLRGKLLSNPRSYAYSYESDSSYIRLKAKIANEGYYDIFTTPEFEQTVKERREQLQAQRAFRLDSIRQEAIRHESFSFFAQNYVQERINEWQRKGEFEKMADYTKRVNLTTRNGEVFRLTKEAESSYIALKSKSMAEYDFKLHEYDSENETFLITATNMNDIVVPVPIKYAPEFKQNWNQVQVYAPEYFIFANKIAFAKLRFLVPKEWRVPRNSFVYSNANLANYVVPQVNYEFDPVSVDYTENDFSKRIVENRIYIGQSDVDTDIPQTKLRQESTFVLIIANEKYNTVANVSYALNDGRTFKQYCIKTLGIPEKNIHFIENATAGQIAQGIKRLRNTLQTYKAESKGILYYAGHGYADDVTREAYILPTDIPTSDLSYAYKLDQLYADLGQTTSSRMTFFVDACFSGAKRDGTAINNERGLIIKPKSNTLYGNSVLFSACTGDQPAQHYHEKRHGLFTYFLLKKLQETKGNVTYGELSEYILDHVTKATVRDKIQEPTTLVSSAMTDNWQKINLSK